MRPLYTQSCQEITSFESQTFLHPFLIVSTFHRFSKGLLPTWPGHENYSDKRPATRSLQRPLKYRYLHCGVLSQELAYCSLKSNGYYLGTTNSDSEHVRQKHVGAIINKTLHEELSTSKILSIQSVSTAGLKILKRNKMSDIATLIEDADVGLVCEVGHANESGLDTVAIWMNRTVVGQSVSNTFAEFWPSGYGEKCHAQVCNRTLSCELSGNEKKSALPLFPIAWPHLAHLRARPTLLESPEMKERYNESKKTVADNKCKANVKSAQVNTELDKLSSAMMHTLRDIRTSPNVKDIQTSLEKSNFVFCENVQRYRRNSHHPSPLQYRSPSPRGPWSSSLRFQSEVICRFTQYYGIVVTNFHTHSIINHRGMKLMSPQKCNAWKRK